MLRELADSIYSIRECSVLQYKSFSIVLVLHYLMECRKLHFAKYIGMISQVELACL